jgi:hypothetical protein
MNLRYRSPAMKHDHARESTDRQSANAQAFELRAAGRPDSFAMNLPDRRSFRGFASWFVVLFAFASLPILLNDNLPLYDYPNHLARMYLLGALPTSPLLQHYYATDWQPLPNLAMDLIVPLLGKVLPLAVAGKLFILLTLFLLAAGPALVHRVLFGSWSNVPLLAFLLLYGRILLWGFLNFLFGLGLALVLFAAWLALRSRPPMLRLLVATSFASILYFAHLEALGIYGVLVIAYEAGIAWQRRETAYQRLVRLAVASLPLLVPLAIFLLDTPTPTNRAIEFSRLGRKFELIFTIFDAEDRVLDFVCFLGVVGVMAVALRRRWLSLAPAMKLPLVALGITYLAMPSHIFGAFGADHRLPLAMALALVASLRWADASEKIKARLMSGAAALFALRLGAILVSWHHSDRIYASLLPVLDAIPEGGRLAIASPPEGVHATVTPLDHVPTLAIIRRNAFVPTLFAFPMQQPIQLTPEFRSLAKLLPPSVLWAYFVSGQRDIGHGDIDEAALGCYDFIVFIARHEFHVADHGLLQLVADKPGFTMYKLSQHEPQSACDRGRQVSDLSSTVTGEATSGAVRGSPTAGMNIVTARPVGPRSMATVPTLPDLR